MIPDWLITLAAGVTVFIAIPALLVFSAILPFLITKKLLKRSFTPINIIISLAAAGGLLYLNFLGLYWGLAYLQGYAACSLYGC